MKITYSEFKQRLLRGGYHCTKIQLEGLYTRYLSDTAPVWVRECLKQKPAAKTPLPEYRPFKSKKSRASREPVILEALATRPMLLGEIASVVGMTIDRARKLLKIMADDGQVVLSKEPVEVAIRSSTMLSHKNMYSLPQSNSPRASQNAKNGGSKPEKLETYRNGCASGLNENLGGAA